MKWRNAVAIFNSNRAFPMNMRLNCSGLQQLNHIGNDVVTKWSNIIKMQDDRYTMRWPSHCSCFTDNHTLSFISTHGIPLICFHSPGITLSVSVSKCLSEQQLICLIYVNNLQYNKTQDINLRLKSTRNLIRLDNAWSFCWNSEPSTLCYLL